MGVSHPFRSARGVLTVLFLLAATSPSLAANRIWVGGGANSNWTTAANWVGGQVPADGDLVIVSASATTSLGTNNIIGLELEGLLIDRGYSLFGNQITLGVSGLSVTADASDAVQISAPLRLGAKQTWKTDGADVFVNGAVALVNRSLNFEVVNGAQIRCGGAIGGDGAIFKNGPGHLRLDGNNTYTGQTFIQQGYVIVGHANGLGAADGTSATGTQVLDSGFGLMSGTLALDNVAIGNESIVAQGEGQSGNSPLQATGISSIAGPVHAKTDIGINVIAPARLTFNGPVSGPGRLSLVHDGTWVFNNSNNSFAGGLGIGEGGDPHSIVIVAANQAIPFTPVQHVPDGAVLTIDAGITQTLAALTGEGGVRLTDENSWLILNGGGQATFIGGLSGSGLVVHTGTGHQIFNGTFASFSGHLMVGNGIVTLLDLTTGGHITANAGGTAALQGATGAGWIVVDGGTLHARALGDTAPIVTATNLLMTPAASLVVDTTNTGQIGRLELSGLVGLAGTLQVPLAPQFSAPAGTVFTLISKSSGGPLEGTFAGLPQGATFTTGKGTFTISYTGGDGNDVTLTLIGIARDYLLSEGATGGFFTTDILIANPNASPAPIRVSFLTPDGGTVDLDDEVPAMARKTIVANNVDALTATEFSTLVRSISGLPLVVERTMTWDQQTGYAAHTERAPDAPAATWYFAEGSQGFFSTFLLLANPDAAANVATVNYLLEGEPPVTRTYDVAPRSRRTIDAGGDPALVNRSFGMVVTFTQPGVAERAMYFGTDPLWRGGHASAGVTTPSTEAFVAEGATGPFFETFILIANPNPADVSVALTFGRQGDTPIAMTRTVAASSRLTLNIETLDPGLANVPVSTSISASAPVIVERAQYWPDPAPQWYEAHSSPALQSTATKWGLAEGRVGGASNYQTYILLANANPSAEAHVSITFLRESGAPFTKTFTVPATERLNVPVGPGSGVPELVDERFGALITSDQPIVVERAMYADAGGQVWAAGTSANATRLP